jgi:hypothetical protein
MNEGYGFRIHATTDQAQIQKPLAEYRVAVGVVLARS